MKSKALLLIIASLIFSLPSSVAFAHVPYVEHWDFTDASPFEVRNSIEQSIAVYSWLETDMQNPSDDIDVYTFEITEPTRVYIEAIVPVCQGYEDFAPWFALVGPGLPPAPMEMPFPIPPGNGAIIMENTAPGQPRTTFYEFFGNQTYYEGPVFDKVIEVPGTYYVYYWDPYELGGDYVAVLGADEIWGFWDIIRALVYTPMIRQDEVLHIECIE